MIPYDRLLRWRTSFLSELETMLGPRNPNYELGEIRPDGQGPMTVLRTGSRTVAEILLTPMAFHGKHSGKLAKWQLAHECLHLIDPYFPGPDEPNTIVMEEGPATWFQNQLQDNYVSCKNYARAQRFVSPHMPEYLPGKIREFRRSGIRIHATTSEHLRRVAYQMDEHTALELTKPFTECCS